MLWEPCDHQLFDGQEAPAEMVKQARNGQKKAQFSSDLPSPQSFSALALFYLYFQKEFKAGFASQN